MRTRRMRSDLEFTRTANGIGELDRDRLPVRAGRSPRSGHHARLASAGPGSGEGISGVTCEHFVIFCPYCSAMGVGEMLVAGQHLLAGAAARGLERVGAAVINSWSL